jgi:hypothetical protein
MGVAKDKGNKQSGDKGASSGATVEQKDKKSSENRKSDTKAGSASGAGGGAKQKQKH